MADRGNVVDIYVGSSPTGRIDREAELVPGLGFEFGFGWEGGEEEIKVAIEDGYGEDIATAIICGFLRGDVDVQKKAQDFIRAVCSA